MGLGQYQWWRRLRGGRWARIGVGLKSEWCRLAPDSIWKVDEDWTSPAIDKSRIYGLDKSVGTATHLDVVVDDAGNVLQLWFRCLAVPFRVKRVNAHISNEIQSRDTNICTYEVLGLHLGSKVLQWREDLECRGKQESVVQ